ncbi:hypothetical protein D3C87_1621290 [compost metagenome]
MRAQRGKRLGPRQAGALTRGKLGGFAPDRNVMQAQLLFALDLGLLDVHVQAEAAAIDLRRADLDQIQDRLLDRPGLQEHAEFDEFLEQLGRLGESIETLTHGDS